MKKRKEKRRIITKQTGRKALKMLFFVYILRPARRKLIRRDKKMNLKRGGGGIIEMQNKCPCSQSFVSGSKENEIQVKARINLK